MSERTVLNLVLGSTCTSTRGYPVVGTKFSMYTSMYSSTSTISSTDDATVETVLEYSMCAHDCCTKLVPWVYTQRVDLHVVQQ